MTEVISDAFANSLVNTCRTSLGDTFLAVVYFTPDDFEVLYQRGDLYGGDPERTRRIKARLVENDRFGFDSQETYRKLASGPTYFDPRLFANREH